MKYRFPSLWLLLFILTCWLNACSSAPESKPESIAIEIDRVVIRNDLHYTVTDVQLLAVLTGNFVSCGLITARTACATGFPGVDYSSGKLVVNWKERGQPQSTGEFELEVTQDIDLSRTASLEVIIFGSGQAGAKLVQKTP